MPPTEPLSYDEIHGVQKRERSTRSVTKIPGDFYPRLSNYLALARAELADESAKGPSPRLLLLQGQFRNLEEMARDIVLLRLRKAGEMSFSAAEGGTINERALTPEEFAFARDVQASVERVRASALKEGLPPGRPAAPAPVAPAEKPAPPAKLSAEPAPHHEAPAPAPVPATDLVLRILDDIAPFETEDGRRFQLKREDIVTLPTNVAQILLRRKKAVEFEVPA
jgi:DNA replication initiation complex subunit (GINS family)